MTDRDSGQNENARDTPSALAAITAGAALFNEDRFLAARDVWEGERRPPDGGDNDGTERLLRGLAATAAATQGAIDGDRSETIEHAQAAAAALNGVADPQGIAIEPVREWAERLAAAPRDVESASVPRIRVGDETPGFDGLSLVGAGIAAPALARTGEPGDAEALATAADLAREERGTGRTRFAELLFAYLRTPDARPQVAARLRDHVDIEERKRRDVDDLF
ncbi:hypothetical protein J2744_002469 [Halorubrum trapanicum]|uniref:DUF309 domain-containing protein n=1 Tax=Halorubrum trapanicum TaxID=29284 RepID=A0A8J7REP3_9EURY|nr:hypothetical protein [Halorubrum trapanicum]MBP1902773.1 hypothetical protein [Halorubrum trapanicum]